MLRAELAHELLVAKLLSWPECSPADVLHLVVRHAQPPSNGAVGSILVRTRRGLRAPELEQQYRLTHLLLELLR